MRVERFEDQYEAAAVAYGVSPEELVDRDRRQTQELLRWVALDGDRVLGAATGWIRPDNKLFLNFGCPDEAAYAPLSKRIAEEMVRDLYVSLSGGDTKKHQNLTEARFHMDLVSEVFEVPFVSVMERLPRPFDVSEFRIVSADEIDPEFLLDIDNRLRNQVPGTDGWVGSLQWIVEELAESPPFDARTYLVGLTDRGDPAGLIRIWRNPDGPRFGMVATLPEFRRSLLGPELIRRALVAASSWGFATFRTETSINNRHIHQRLLSVGARSLGFVYQMVFRPGFSTKGSW